MNKMLRVLLAWLLLAVPASAQGVAQLGSGTIWGNSSAARAPASQATLTAIIDRAISSTQGALMTRNGSAWIGLAPGAAGLAVVSGGAGVNLAYGVVGLNGGGCNAALSASNGGILYSTASACAILAGTATARQMLQSGASTTPAWSTATWPATVSQGDILYGSAANVVSSLAKDTNATRYISNTGVSNSPAWAQIALGTGVANGGTSLGSGTSGGVLGYTASGTLASSVALTANALVLGGGAGATPTPMGSLGTTTTVLHGNAAGAPTYAAVAYADIAAAAIATTSQWWANTASLLLTTDQIWAGGAVQTLTDAATVTPDFGTAINFKWTLGATGRTLASPSNVKVGQTGTIQVIEDGTGSRTITTYGSTWKFAGGTKPTLTATAAATDLFSYFCYTTTACVISALADVK